MKIQKPKDCQLDNLEHELQRQNKALDFFG